MDADAELQLYNHVEFVAAKTNPREHKTQFSKSKPTTKRKTGKKSQVCEKIFHVLPFSRIENLFQSLQSAKNHANKVSNGEYQLTANELLFIPKQYDSTPLRHPTAKASNDFIQKRNYMQKIKGKDPDAQRQLRAKQDARYLHHKAKNPNELSLLKTNEERLLCLDHLNGRCKSSNCGKHHQLRNPRLFGVCKYFLTGSCRDADLCPYMHEEFPCRYYHLNIPHPRTMKIDECRFKHGGPLSRQLGRYFKKQLEDWVKKLTIAQPQLFDNTLLSYVHKFDEKQNQLEQEYGVRGSSVALTTSNESQSPFEHILSVDQIKALAKKNITNVAQLNRVPIDELMDCYRLTMDQIYKITIDTSNQSDQSNQASISHDNDVALDNLSNNESNLNQSSSPTDAMDADSSFEGFCDNELNDAEDELQFKKVIAHKEQIAISGIDAKPDECNTAEIENSGESDLNANSSDDSNDSDDELNLLIDEDI